jgi:urease accessory protein
MIANLGAKVARTSAPFDPEPGAYAGEAAHGHHHHSHDHDHDHTHIHGYRHEH